MLSTTECDKLMNEYFDYMIVEIQRDSELIYKHRNKKEELEKLELKQYKLKNKLDKLNEKIIDLKQELGIYL